MFLKTDCVYTERRGSALCLHMSDGIKQPSDATINTKNMINVILNYCTQITRNLWELRTRRWYVSEYKLCCKIRPLFNCFCYLDNFHMWLLLSRNRKYICFKINVASLMLKIFGCNNQYYNNLENWIQD